MSSTYTLYTKKPNLVNTVTSSSPADVVCLIRLVNVDASDTAFNQARWLDALVTGDSFKSTVSLLNESMNSVERTISVFINIGTLVYKAVVTFTVTGSFILDNRVALASPELSSDRVSGLRFLSGNFIRLRATPKQPAGSEVKIDFVYAMTFSFTETGPVIKIVSWIEGTYIFTGRPSILTAPAPGMHSCPRLIVFTSTDVIYASNASQSIFRRLNEDGSYNEWERNLGITRLVSPKECMTLTSKVRYNGALYPYILNYASMRYFLWFLITDKWCIDILLRRNTKRFFDALEHSIYACWIEYFNTSPVSGYDKYFLW